MGSDLHVLGGIGVELGELGGRVLGAVGRGVADDHHDGSVGVYPLRHPEVINALISDEVCEVVLEHRINTRQKIN